MPRKVEIRTDSTKFDLIINNDVTEHYADGLGQLMIGPTMSKVLLYTSLGLNDNGIEERFVNQRLNIPTQALLELANEVYKAVSANKEFITAELTKSIEGMKTKLDKLKTEPLEV